MSQISPPIRIVLVLAVAVMGVYMLFLRPKTEVAPPAAPAPNVQTGAPAVSQPGKVAQAAQGAVNAANGQLQSQESVDGVQAGESAAGTATTTTPPATKAPAAAKPAVDVSGLPKPIAKAIRQHQALVLLFWNGKSADDEAVHAALKHVDRWDGRVYVGSASIKKISKYGRIARGVDVEQSPTVVVVDPELRAETLVGYVDAPTIDQAVVDAFRNTDGLYTDPYLRKVDAVCSHAASDISQIPSAGNGREFNTATDAYVGRITKFKRDFAAVKAPKKWRAFRTASLDDLQGWELLWLDIGSRVGPKATTAQAVAALNHASHDGNSLSHRINKRFDAKHLYGCGSQF